MQLEYHRIYDVWEKAWKEWDFVVQRTVEQGGNINLYVKKDKDILYFISMMDETWNNVWNEARKI